jgi:hypothetical protein
MFGFDFQFRRERDEVIRAIDIHTGIAIQFKTSQQENLGSVTFEVCSKQSTAL